MLSQLRKGASGWVAQLLIAILVLSFALWGVADIFSGFRADTVTTRRQRRHHDPAVPAAVRHGAHRAPASRPGSRSPRIRPSMFGLPQQVLGRLIADATLDDIASSSASAFRTRRSPSRSPTIPPSPGPNGTFDRSYFNQLLRSNGLNEDQYIAERRGTMSASRSPTA